MVTSGLHKAEEWTLATIAWKQTNSFGHKSTRKKIHFIHILKEPWLQVKPFHWKPLGSSRGFVYKAVTGDSIFWIYGWNLRLWPFKWKPLRKTLLRRCLLYKFTSSELFNLHAKFFNLYLGSSVSFSTWFFSPMSCSRTVSMMSHSMSLGTPSGEGPGSFREWSECNKHSWLVDPISHRSC